MEDKLDNQQFENFEGTILNQEKTGEIKYSIDRDIEASVRYDYLSEIHGIEKVKNALDGIGKTFIDLSDTNLFREISERLSKI
jgi:hypothetical protein